MRVLGALLFLLVLAGHAAAERRLALVVGNDRYDEVTNLRKAVNDAHAMADALRPLGFDVDVVDNASRTTLSRRLVDFERRLQPGDTALFFFAGHGVELRGENYLLPVDVPNAGEGEEGLVEDTAFAAGDIITRIRSRGAGRVIAIFDACRNNPFDGSLGTRALGGDSQGLAGMEAPEGVFVLMSAGAKQEALDTLGDDDASPNSIFTRALVEALDTPGLSLVQIAKQTQLAVDRLASTVSHEQTPAYSDNIRGDLVLNAVPDAPSAPAATGGSATAELAAWRRIEASRAAEDFAAYLDQFGPSAIFADAARQRIAALATQPDVSGTRDADGETAQPSAANPVEPGPAAEADARPVATPEFRLADTARDEIVFAPGGGLVATYGKDADGDATGQRVRIWSREGTLVRTLEPTQGDIVDARFSPDGSLLAIAGRSQLSVRDTASGREIAAWSDEREMTSLAFSTDGAVVATGNDDGTVRFRDARTGRLLDTFHGPPLSGNGASRRNIVAFDPAGETVVSAQGEGEWGLRLWDRETGRLVRDFAVARCAEDCAVRGIRFYDGLIFASVGADDIFVLDPETGRTLSHFNGRLMLIARNGENPAAMVAAGAAIRIYDAMTGGLVQAVESADLSSARFDDDLKLGARRSPDDGSWLLFLPTPAQSAAK